METENERGVVEVIENQNDGESSKNLTRTAAPLNHICGVCGALAPDHLHFGAQTCYSCRAFFRRTSQRTLAKGLKRCKTGLNMCEVSAEKKSCIHCRYMKCLEIGMTPDKMQGKRKKDASNNAQEDGDESVVAENKIKEDEQLENIQSIKRPKLTETRHLITKEEKSKYYPQNHTVQPSNVPVSGYPYPTSPNISQMHEDRKRTFPLAGSSNEFCIKTEPKLVYSAKSLANNTSCIKSHQGVLLGQCNKGPINNDMKYPEKKPNPLVPPRPSVIKSVKAAKEQEQPFLQFEAQMLKMHGDMLTQTGNLFNYHASIINQHSIQQQAAQLETHQTQSGHSLEQTQINVEPEKEKHVMCTIAVEALEEVEPKVLENLVIQKVEDPAEQKKIEVLVNTNENIMEEHLELHDFLDNSPWAIAMEKYFAKDLEVNLEDLVNDTILESSASTENEEEEASKTEEYHNTSSTNLTHLNTEKVPDDVEASSASRISGSIFANIGPDLVFTTEELSFLSQNQIVHKNITQSTCPISLHKSRVAHFMGRISKEGMLKICSAGRKAQNYYHYMSMTSQPFFNELTTRTQNLLMKHNTQLCFALNIANYFFGHKAQTLVEQEEVTGLVSGIRAYIRDNAPEAFNMPPAPYDDYFCTPWATDREDEAKHRELSKSIGESLRELDFSAYLLLYGLTLYSISQQALDQLKIIQKDRQILRKAQSYLDLLYKRYTKHLVGWKKASETRLNQHFLLGQMSECVLIFEMKNLNLSDNELTNSKSLDVTSVSHQT